MEILELLKPFIQPHPSLYPKAGDIFVPINGNKIRFFFEGGFSISSDDDDFEINFNDKDIIIIVTGRSVYRFLRRALIGFELVRVD